LTRYTHILDYILLFYKYQFIKKIQPVKVSEIMERNKKAPARAKAKIEYILTTKLFAAIVRK
jgi:hypothetical protein